MREAQAHTGARRLLDLSAAAEAHAMQVSCKWCGRVHPRGYVCPRKPARTKRGTAQAAIRNTYRWQKTRAAVYQRDHGLCRLCLAEGRITTSDLQAHHIIPLEESTETAYSMDWIITLCSGNGNSCHERAERGDVSRSLLHSLAMEPVAVPETRQNGQK